MNNVQRMRTLISDLEVLGSCRASQSLRVLLFQLLDDQEMESDETLRMTFSSPGLPLGMVNVSTPTITIIDNDMGKCKSKSNLFASRTSNENKTQYCTPFHAVVGFDPTIGGSV